MVAKPVVESVLQGAGQGEVLQKQGGTWGNFGSAGADNRFPCGRWIEENARESAANAKRQEKHTSAGGSQLHLGRVRTGDCLRHGHFAVHNPIRQTA